MESEFLGKIAEDPHEWVPKLILADWLEERGDLRGEMIRLQHTLLTGKWGDAQAVKRLLELLGEGIVAPCPRMHGPHGMSLRLLPPGTFMMGSPRDERERFADEGRVEVTLTRGFWLGELIVSQREWTAVMGDEPWSGKEYVEPDGPAQYIDHHAATAFCETLSRLGGETGQLPADWEYRLPTEAQWEYACRAGTSTRFHCGDDESLLNEYAWFADTRDTPFYPFVARTLLEPVIPGLPVSYGLLGGQKRPNAWGLFDMHGNVWEWCRDCYRWKRSGGLDPEFTSVKVRERIYRGGDSESHSKYCRSANRGKAEPEFQTAQIGFRVAAVPVSP